MFAAGCVTFGTHNHAFILATPYHLHCIIPFWDSKEPGITTGDQLQPK
ncbi:hypothetical protein GRFL_1564 [Christiangramia flava JLT2011]|uniref:Uncharacterized protein n=1 Tax=Christiangramia flava JLT2011 TaxID=1229726 RepID=A0A1L7I3V5_9FLAO|nr:hypothetical protein GRFL_1564 [Christiangramia flava JLT2011]